MPSADADAKIPCPTPQHLQGELEALSAILELGEKEETWEKLEKVLIRFAGVTRGGGYKYLPLYVEGVGRKGAGLQIATCMLSDRGRLSGVAIELLQTLAPRLGPQFAPLVSLYFDPLVKLLGRPNKVFLKRAEKCLATIISHCHLPSILPELNRGLRDEAATCRRGCATGFERAVTEWDREVFGEKGAVVLEEAVRRMATDKNPEVRAIGKRVWGAFMEIWPERVEDFSDPLTPTIRRYLAIPAKGSAAVKPKVPIKAAAPPTHRPVSTTSSVSSTGAPPPPRPQHDRVASLATKPVQPRHAPPATNEMPPPPVQAGPSHRRVSPRKEVVPHPSQAAVSVSSTSPTRPLQPLPLHKSASAVHLPPSASAEDAEPYPFHLGKHGRSVSHAVLPSSSSTHALTRPTSPPGDSSRPLSKPSRPVLPISQSTTALPSHLHSQSDFPYARKFAPPERILRPFPTPSDPDAPEWEMPEGGLFVTPSGNTVLRGAVRPDPQKAGRKGLGMGRAERRVVTNADRLNGDVVPVVTPGLGLMRTLRSKDVDKAAGLGGEVVVERPGEPATASKPVDDYFNAAAPYAPNQERVQEMTREEAEPEPVEELVEAVDPVDPASMPSENRDLCTRGEDAEDTGSAPAEASEVSIQTEPTSTRVESQDVDQKERSEQARLGVPELSDPVVAPDTAPLAQSADAEIAVEVAAAVPLPPTGEDHELAEDPKGPSDSFRSEEVVVPPAVPITAPHHRAPTGSSKSSTAPARPLSRQASATHVKPPPNRPAPPAARSVSTSSKTTAPRKPGLPVEARGGGRAVSGPIAREAFKPVRHAASTTAKAGSAGPAKSLASSTASNPATTSLTSSTSAAAPVVTKSKVTTSTTSAPLPKANSSTAPRTLAPKATATTRVVSKPPIPPNQPAKPRVVSAPAPKPIVPRIASQDLPPPKRERVTRKAPIPHFVPVRKNASAGQKASAATGLNASTASDKAIVAKVKPEQVPLPPTPGDKAPVVTSPLASPRARNITAKVKPESIAVAPPASPLRASLRPQDLALPPSPSARSSLLHPKEIPLPPSPLPPSLRAHTAQPFQARDSLPSPFAKVGSPRPSSPLVSSRLVDVPSPSPKAADRFASTSTRYASTRPPMTDWSPSSSDGEQDGRDDDLENISFKASLYGGPQRRPKVHAHASPSAGNLDLLEFSKSSRPATGKRGDVSTPGKSAEGQLKGLVVSGGMMMGTPRSDGQAGRKVLVVKDVNGLAGDEEDL